MTATASGPQVSGASLTIITSALDEVRAFHERHFAAQATFDCGWYVVLRLGGGAELCLMAPQPGMTPFAGGACLNLVVDDVDGLHAALTAAGVAVVVPLEDHPWGDRGFGVVDPAGLMVYPHRAIPPAPEFAGAFKDPAG